LSNIIELRLSGDQVEQFATIIAKQREQESLCVMILAHSYQAEYGETIVRLQCKMVEWRTGAKITKILRQTEENE
jgi:hypothetical protein